MLDGVTAPILEIIRVKSDDVVHPIYTLLKGHEIRRVSLTQPDLGFFTQTLPLLWDPLTHLALLNEDADMSVAPSSVTYSILRKCPSLVSLQFQLCTTGDGIPGDPVHFPVLRSLTIPAPFLADTQSDAVFLSCLGTSSPQLESLEFYLASFTLLSLSSTIPLFPSLRAIRINDLHPDWDLPVDALEYVTAETLLPLLPELCPALQEIDIRDGQLSEECVLAFTEKQPFLRRLHVQFDRFRDETVLDLWPLVSPELDISVRYSEPWTGSTPWEGLDESAHPF
ncbi:hypothetical protein B0H13DRAFT_2340051 [Mycena leptocephala]|nr:hypothetical protein B0H13DRAFT_2340051 [Mycena leptocephala]